MNISSSDFHLLLLLTLCLFQWFSEEQICFEFIYLLNEQRLSEPLNTTYKISILNVGFDSLSWKVIKSFSFNSVNIPKVDGCLGDWFAKKRFSVFGLTSLLVFCKYELATYSKKLGQRHVWKLGLYLRS